MQIEMLTSWLESYQERQQDFEASCERLERLESKLTSPRPAALSGMPGAAVSDPDRLAIPLAELEELRQSVATQAAALRDLRNRIEGAVRLVNGPNWAHKRAVIRMRYIDGEKFETIAQLLFGRDPDFLMKQDSYTRRVFKVRKAALRELAQNPRIYDFIHEEEKQ